MTLGIPVRPRNACSILASCHSCFTGTEKAARSTNPPHRCTQTIRCKCKNAFEPRIIPIWTVPSLIHLITHHSDSWPESFRFSSIVLIPVVWCCHPSCVTGLVKRSIVLYHLFVNVYELASSVSFVPCSVLYLYSVYVTLFHEKSRQTRLQNLP